MYALIAVCMVLIGIGHLAIWTRLHCMIHSLPYKQWLIDTGEYTCYLMSVLIPAVFLLWWMQQPLNPQATANEPVQYSTMYYLWLTYGVISAIAFIAASVLWLLYWREAQIASNYYSQRLLASFDFSDLAPQLLTSKNTQIASLLPGNEILRLEVNRKEIFLPRLPKELDGFTITHLSDLHLKGHMAEDFYRKVIAQANDLQSEMVVIAGDIFDRTQCFPWSRTLAELTAECGVYFILGNHEVRTHDTAGCRKVLADEGLIDLGGRHIEVTIRGYPVVLAGNELPWHVPAADMRSLDESQFEQRPFRLLLAHTPDQIDWARSFDFDLVLSGHNHGGQIRLPGLGAIVSPSWHGTRYSGGMFYCDPTLMHVSRGISGTSPLRWNCPPEISQLVLRQGDQT